ncbi:MAG: hypothetical protein HYS08_05035 [Chlamydiae bacterium]|nr:hypothetical protein [Chlamydiota bacterium]MBI3267116.1 hypothetical protein [Chlamydiota bacterium]
MKILLSGLGVGFSILLVLASTGICSSMGSHHNRGTGGYHGSSMSYNGTDGYHGTGMNYNAQYGRHGHDQNYHTGQRHSNAH